MPHWTLPAVARLSAVVVRAGRGVVSVRLWPVHSVDAVVTGGALIRGISQVLAVAVVPCLAWFALVYVVETRLIAVSASWAGLPVNSYSERNGSFVN